MKTLQRQVSRTGGMILLLGMARMAAGRMGAMVARTVEANGGRLAVIVSPYSFQFDRAPDDPLLAPQRHLAALAQREGIPLLDLLEPLQAAREPVYLAADPVHLNPAGHRLVAEVLAQWLRDEGLVPEA